MKPISQNLRLNLVLVFAFLVAASFASVASAATFLWNVASPGANNWNVNANWSPNTGNPGASDTAVFGTVGTAANATTVNNVVSANTAITSLFYTNYYNGQWHVTQIPSGVTLTVTGGVTVGGQNDPNVTNTAVAFVDAGTLFVSGGNYVVGNSSGSGSFINVTNDLSALSNFIYSVSTGFFNFGNSNRAGGTMNLAAASNSITAGTLNIGTGSSSSSGTARMQLGAGTNVFNASSFNVAAGRETGTLQFFGSTGGWRLRGTGGTDADRSTLTVGVRDQGGTGGSPVNFLTTPGNILVNGHPVDLKVSTMTLGRMSRTQSGSDGGYYLATGVLQFDQGTVDATTLNMGICSGNSTNSSGIGTITVGANGTLLAGNISLVNVSATAANVGATGTVSIVSGTVNCTGNITKTTATGNGVVAMNGGALTVGGTLGTGAIPINSFNLTNAAFTIASAATAKATVTTLNTDGATNVINISLVPAITTYPAQFQVIKYSSLGGLGFANIGLSNLPPASPSYSGYLSNNTTTSTIDLVITAGPIPAQPIVWSGATNGDWDSTTLNWVIGATATNYNAVGDFVTFDDSASNATVNLTTTLTPGSITVNNTLSNYTFNGVGKISGLTGLTKQGNGTLVLDNNTANDFSGNISISAGTLQFGTGGTSGALPASINVTNNGTLILNRSGTLAVANLISGSGSVTHSGPSTATFSAQNTFAGGLTVSGGTVRGTVAKSAGTGVVTVNTGGTYVAGVTQTNNYTLAGGTLGVVSGAMSGGVPGELTAAASTTSILYIADPQNLAATDATEVIFTNTWHGSGNVIVASVTNDTNFADGGNGFRLRGTAASDFSGTITISNNVKGELQTSVAAFSPAGTGKVVLNCGAYNGGNTTGEPFTGGYSELNLKNNFTGDAVLGNNIELTGSGLAVLNPNGSAAAGSKITMGSLRIGGGQELAVYLSAAPAHVVVFTNVTLTGATATFSPKNSAFGSATSAGSDLSLGDIGELSASSIVMNGVSNLFVTGTCTYSGTTTVSNGTLIVSGALNGGGALIVAGGTLKGNGSTAGTLTVNPAGTLAPGTSVGRFTAAGAVTLNGTNAMEIDRTAGTNDVLQASSITYGGTLVISSLSSALQAGDTNKLFDAGSYSGTFGTIVPVTPGTDLLWNTNTLATDGTLRVISAVVPQPVITSVVLSGTDLIISGTNGTTSGNYYVLTSTNVALAVTNWDSIATNSFVSGNFNFTNTVDPATPERFYRIAYPLP